MGMTVREVSENIGPKEVVTGMGKTVLMRGVVICTAHKCHYDHRMNDIEIGWACGMYGGRRELRTGFWWGYLEERHSLEDHGIYGGKY